LLYHGAMNHFEQVAAINAALARGDTLFCLPGDAGLTPCSPREKGARPLFYPRIGIYAGSGTSHSWLWYADLFDRMGFYDLAFFDESAVEKRGLTDLDVLVVSGGDTFAVAEGLGPAGASSLRVFVGRGGLYIGSCAGAYLPMSSSKNPLHLFNCVNVKVKNLSRVLPESVRMSHKFYSAYGCDFIFHPVREEVTVRTRGIPPFQGSKKLLAPLYGGPSMWAGENAEVLAHYEGFTNKTVFLVDRSLAEEILLGSAAVVRQGMGAGYFYLFGPHFEHPHFPEANKRIAETILWHTGKGSRPSEKGLEILEGKISAGFVRDLKRELSNSRIVAAGMEMMPLRWKIGDKLYEPEKIRVFLDAMWKRIEKLEKKDRIVAQGAQVSQAVRDGVATTGILRRIKGEIEEGHETLSTATELFVHLRKFSSTFLEIYFKTLAEGRT
jgi:glutamine amidotransferase-like uncharacterized protein